MSSPGKRFAAGERGSALVEFAVTLPLLATMMFAIARFGLAFNNNLVLTDAVRTGARQLAVSRGKPNPCSAASDKVRDAATTLTAASITLSTTVNGTAYSGTAASGNTPSCNGAGVLMTAGNDVTVVGTYPCSIVIYGVNFAPSCVMTSQMSARVE